MKPQPSQPQQTPIQPPAPARWPHRGTCPPNGSLGGNPASTSAAGPSTAPSPGLGRPARDSGMPLGAEEVLLAQPAAQPPAVDTVVFKPSDGMMIRFGDVDFNAIMDKLTDCAIAKNSKVKGEQKEKVLQPWEGGDANTDDYDLESDMSKGWDPKEMFKFNEEKYGVKTTYDRSLSSYTVPLKKDNSEDFRQRKLRAAQLAREIKTSPRSRIAMEKDDGRTEEEEHSSGQRQGSGRDSPSLGSREGKSMPVPQKMRKGGRRRRVQFSSSRGVRPGIGSLPPRGGPNHPDNSGPSPGPEFPGITGDPSRVSPKARRPRRGAKTMSSPSSCPPGEASISPPTDGRMCPPRSPKSAAPAPASASCPEPPIGSAVPPSTASVSPVSSVREPGAGPISTTSPKVTAPNDGNEVPQKEPGRSVETPELARIAGKAPGLQNEQKLYQLEEMKKIGAQFKLQSSGSPETSLDPFSTQEPKEGGVEAKGKEKEVDGLLAPEPLVSSGSSKTESPPDKEGKLFLPSTGGAEGPEQSQTHGQNQMDSPPGGISKGDDKEEGPVTDQVKKSTLNPNAKEFIPSKPLLSLNDSASTPISPGPWTHSAPLIPVLTDQSGMYSPQYIFYIPQIYMVAAIQAPQMYPYPVPNSVPGQQGKYWGPIMQVEAAAGPPLVAATPYSSYISYNPQQFPGQPIMMQPMAHYLSQPVFAPMLQSNPRMLTSGSHPQAIFSPVTLQYPPAEQPTPQALYATDHQSYPHHAMQLHVHQPHPATTPTGSQLQSQHVALSPVQHQAGQPQQNLYHPGALTGTPPSLPLREASLSQLQSMPSMATSSYPMASPIRPMSPMPMSRLESEQSHPLILGLPPTPGDAAPEGVQALGSPLGPE